MMKYISFVGVVWYLTMMTACSTVVNPEPGELFAIHCGRCHQAPDPADLPKSIWEKNVLPEMAARMGLHLDGYDPFNKMPWQEKALIENAGGYPAEATISGENWEKIKAYILYRAPETLEPDTPDSLPLKPLTLFSAEMIRVDDVAGAHTTFLDYDAQQQHFVAGDYYGQFRTIRPGGAEVFNRVNSPATWWTKATDGNYATDVGILAPSELSKGNLTKFSAGKSERVWQNLHRPVFTLVKDLDGDGTEEILICEYGNFSGELSMLKKDGKGKYQKSTLLAVPGTIRVKAADMDGDNMDDLVVLAAQGNEGVYILFQKANLQFESKQVIRLSPVYGSSWMEVVDYEGDGDLDVITAQGDNADFSFTLKPFHGVRIFINDGENDFTQKYFYPLYGATRVMAEDFDQDGDLDLAICAYFPDFDRSPESSFVFLENTNPATFEFSEALLPEAVNGRWLVAATGDYDGDGFKDIMLGSYSDSPSPAPQMLQKQWLANGVDLMLLRNRQHK